MTALFAGLLVFTGCSVKETAAAPEEAQVSEDTGYREGSDPSVVYFTSEITPESLVRIYEELAWQPEGKTGIKISTGEPPASNYLRPELIADLVRKTDGTIVECMTAYGGARSSAAMHKQVAEDHGFTAIAPFDLLDEEGEIELPVPDGKHLRSHIVGSHYQDYGSYIILSHFKGHQMAGFGGAIKNIAIGFGSKHGKVNIHSAGTRTEGSIMHNKQEEWLEAMAEAGLAVKKSMSDGDTVIYINVMNRLSVDCDCNGNPAEPDIHDIGILASRDPVALDQACVDLIYEAEGNASLVKRIESKMGIHTLEYGEKIGLGSRSYELVDVNE